MLNSMFPNQNLEIVVLIDTNDDPIIAFMFFSFAAIHDDKIILLASFLSFAFFEVIWI